MSTIHATQDEIRIIQNELARLENTIQRLQERRVALLQRLNHVHSSTRALPPEVLSRIFACAYPPAIHFDPDFGPCWPGGYQDSVLTLGRVSSYWRQVAWSTPQLWTSLVIHVDEERAHGVAGILDLHFHNTRDLPFSLNVSFDYYDPKEYSQDESREKFIPVSKRTLESIEAVFFRDEYSRKIENLELHSPPTRWLALISTNFRLLKHISISGAPQALPSPSESLFYRPPPISFAAIPQLHSMALSLCRQRWKIALPYQSITRLVLEDIPIDITVKLLVQFPNLVNFFSGRPEDPISSGPGTNFFNSTTIFPHLQHFSWFYHPSSWCLAAHRRIRLPALQTLTWENYRGDAGTDPEVEQAVQALFPHPSHTIHTVNLVYIVSWTPALFRYIFSRSISVQELSLDHCDNSSVHGVLCALCPGWNGDETLYLPSLKSLTITGYPEDPSFGQEISSQILELHRRRSNVQNPLFVIRVDLRAEFTREAAEELSEMIQVGFVEGIKT